MNSHSILVVEDDEDIARNLKTLLTGEGFTVECAANGKIAIDQLQTQSTLPCLILLDLTMPVMDGFQFRHEQKLQPHLRAIPVIIMTADAQIDAKARKTDVQAFIRKPLDLDQLFTLIHQYC